MATRIDITLERLHQLQARVDRQTLAAQDWPVVAGLVSMLIARTEARQDRLRAKAAQQAAGQQDKQTASGPSPAAADAVATAESSKPALDDETTPGAGAGCGEPPADSTEPDPPKGHGRNGADAFAHATTHLHCLAAGIIGAVCALCGVGRVFPYRNKVILRVVGQPLFRAERHIFERERCRACRLPHRVSTKPRGSCQQARACSALGLPRPTRAARQCPPGPHSCAVESGAACPADGPAPAATRDSTGAPVQLPSWSRRAAAQGRARA